MAVVSSNVLVTKAHLLLLSVFVVCGGLSQAFQPLCNHVLPSRKITTAATTSTTKLYYNENSERSNNRISQKNRRDTADAPIECYIVEDDEETFGGNDGVRDDFYDEFVNGSNNHDAASASNHNKKPRVVCTSEPEEYAWFNGIDPNHLIPTDGTETGSMECVEGASPRGIPEWECE